MDHPGDEGVYLNTAVWALVGVSSVFLAARVYSKFRSRRRLWWDDALIIVAWLCLVVSCIFCSLSVSHGLGKHIETVAPEHVSVVGFTWQWTGTFAILAATLSKTSFAVTLLRVLDGSSLRVLLWFIIVTMNVAMSLNAIFGWVRCTPIEKGWHLSMPGTCWTPGIYSQYGMFAGGYSAAMDFILAALPWKLVWTLKMKGREKVGVALALSLGIFAGSTAVVRTALITSLSGDDFTYDGVRLAVWTAAEPAVTVMATTIPLLRPLFIEIKQKTKRSISTNEWTHKKTKTGQSTVTVTADRTRFENEANETKGSGLLGAQEEGRILQTREVAIEYEDRIETDSTKDEVELSPMQKYDESAFHAEFVTVPKDIDR